jgi:hypothetical protein
MIIPRGLDFVITADAFPAFYTEIKNPALYGEATS